MLSIFNKPGPNISKKEARTIVRDAYGLDLSATMLTSERDQNYLLKEKAGPKYVLKISHASESIDVLEMQHAALAHIFLNDPEMQLPNPVNTLDGKLIFRHKAASNENHYIRMVEYVPGESMKDLEKQTNGLINDLGSLLGRLDLALHGFEHPAARRSFPWDVAQTQFLITNQDNIRSKGDQLIIQHFLKEYEKNIVPISHDLNRAVIHNDGNDHNVIVNNNNRAHGIIDFGDMVHTYIICESAVCLAYLVINNPDPIDLTSELIRAYQKVFPLTELEISMIIYFICLRLCISVTMAAYRKQLFPDNKYITVTEDQAWVFLRKMKCVDLQSWSDQVVNKTFH